MGTGVAQTGLSINTRERCDVSPREPPIHLLHTSRERSRQHQRWIFHWCCESSWTTPCREVVSHGLTVLSSETFNFLLCRCPGFPLVWFQNTPPEPGLPREGWISHESLRGRASGEFRFWGVQLNPLPPTRFSVLAAWGFACRWWGRWKVVQTLQITSLKGASDKIRSLSLWC